MPENDSTTLFTGSGMQPMLPYLLGKKEAVILKSERFFLPKAGHRASLARIHGRGFVLKRWCFSIICSNAIFFG